MRTVLRVSVLLSLLLPAVAAAQGAVFEITPLAGYRFSGQVSAYDDFDDEFVDTDLELEEGEYFGVLFDIPLSPNWKLELLANRQETTFIVDEGLFDPILEIGDVTISHYHVGMLYEWGLGQVRPFFVGSLGIAQIEPDSPRVDAEDRFAGSLGGGVKLFLNRHVGFRLEGRWYWTDFDAGFEDDFGHDHHEVNEALYQGEASAGLIFAF